MLANAFPQPRPRERWCPWRGLEANADVRYGDGFRSVGALSPGVSNLPTGPFLLCTLPNSCHAASVNHLIAGQAFVRSTLLLGASCLIVAAGNATARWSWQEPQSKVLPTGDLAWAPQPFQFKAGSSIRYIAFDSGNDSNDGLSKQTPWKHHPWDPNATSQAKACNGTHTYVFKQGVVYRGELNATESGTQGAPVILSPDPPPSAPGRRRGPRRPPLFAARRRCRAGSRVPTAPSSRSRRRSGTWTS